MKILIVSFAIWAFVVPTAVAIFLIATFLADQTAGLYVVFASLALGLSISAIVWGPFWLVPVLLVTFRLFPQFQQRTNRVKEKKYEKCLES